MKLFSLVLVTMISVASSASLANADGAVFSVDANKIIKDAKIGKSYYTVNGKKSDGADRECILSRTNLANNSIDRDALTVALTGKAVPNNYNVNPFAVKVQGKDFWDGPIFYDPTSKEFGVLIYEGHKFTYCVASAAAGKECDAADRSQFEVILTPKDVSVTRKVFAANKQKTIDIVGCKF